MRFVDAALTHNAVDGVCYSDFVMSCRHYVGAVRHHLRCHLLLLYRVCHHGGDCEVGYYDLLLNNVFLGGVGAEYY